MLPGLKSRLTALLCLLSFCSPAQKNIAGTVSSAATGEPLSFATIRFGTGTDGIFSDIDGRFSATVPDTLRTLLVSYMGFRQLEYPLGNTAGRLSIRLEPLANALPEVTVRNTTDRVRYIMNRAISARDRNEPGHHPWYQCTVYYKMSADLLPTGSDKKDSAFYKILAEFAEDKHILFSETHSRRSYKRPGNLQDEVLATRLSGWKQAPFASLVTDVLPFDTYSDFLKLNGRDFANPVSRGWQARYRIRLVDEVLQGKDTLFILSFEPRQSLADNLLSGQFYIHSGQYAIAYFTGGYNDERMGQDFNLVQQYVQVKPGLWFPDRLSYEMQWKKFTIGRNRMNLQLRGSSCISELSFEEPPGFRFDKSKPIKLADGAMEAPAEYWNAHRPDTLGAKEQTTYGYMDSLFHEYKIDKAMPVIAKLSEGKIPVRMLDIDIAKIYSFNAFEKTRLGLGLQTNDQVMKRASIGWWAGYGFEDKQWKYGAFAEFSLDRYKDKTIRLGYDRNLLDPGRMTIHRELDRNYLQSLMMRRADRIENYFIRTDARLGYWDVGLEGHYQHIVPQYNYVLLQEEGSFNRFDVREASLSLRYAPGEKRSPSFGLYRPVFNPAIPKFYLKIATGNIRSGKDYSSDYLQAIAAVRWTKHVNRIGRESFLLTSGVLLGSEDLPISKTFAGKGYLNPDYPIYSFGGFATMRPYEYYSDRFVSFNWKHDFDWKLYNLAGWSRPYISLAHSLLYGEMKKPGVHREIDFAVPDNTYHESGVMLNDLLKLSYYNLAYINIHGGYFYHWASSGFDLKMNGNFVFALSFGL